MIPSYIFSINLCWQVVGTFPFALFLHVTTIHTSIVREWETYRYGYEWLCATRFSGPWIMSKIIGHKIYLLQRRTGALCFEAFGQNNLVQDLLVRYGICGCFWCDTNFAIVCFFYNLIHCTWVDNHYVHLLKKLFLKLMIRIFLT